MEFVSPGWLITGIIGLIIIWTNKALRGLILLGLVLFVGLAVFRSLVHHTKCDGERNDCMVDLQPTWAGPCFPTDGAAVLKSDGRYYLTSDSTTVGGAVCVDWRPWR
jgi:hypothetical protein